MRIYFSKKANLKINIKMYYGTFLKMMNIIVASLCALAFVLIVACAVLSSQIKKYTVEVGSEISAEDICGEGAYFGLDFDPACIDETGVYRFTVHTPKRDRTVRLSVVDTMPPHVTVRDVTFAINGELPTPYDFIESVYEPNGLSGEFVSEIPEIKQLGTYYVKVRYFDASGNKSEIFEVKMTQIYDSVPPTLTSDPIITAYVGEPVEYMPHVVISDNCVGSITLDADERELDLSQVGEYEVYLVAKDSVGNKSEPVSVTVKVAEHYESDILDRLIEEAYGEIYVMNSSRETICRRIYDYVRNTVEYTGISQKGDVRRAAYYGIVSGEGDCYTYFALSKVLFDRFGIENKDIERSYGYTVDTHFWSLVNIGDDAERWYHFDATILRNDGYEHSGCLLTDAQIDAYSEIRKHFYKYEKNEYPASSTEIITRTPNLEKYY